jgi:nitronate monooxygenase
MVLVTRVTKMLGIKHPIIQGGMHYVGYAELAAAVSNAGGLGIVTALTQPTPEDLRKEIRKTKTLTDKPFGVNLTLLPVGGKPDYQGYANVIVEEGIKIVETAGRNPKKWIPFFKQSNIIVIHKCVAIRHAISAQKLGADILSVDGFECGGHPGEEDVPNLILLAVAAKKLTIPFIASGGIANGRQMAACLALGAEGVNMGTRFMATKEAPIKQGIKEALVKADERSTTHVFRTLKNTERVYKNKTSMEVRAIEGEHPGEFERIRHLVLGANYKTSFQETGDADSSVWSCGLSIALVDDIPTCETLLLNMVAECEEVLQNSAKFIKSSL